MEASLGSSHAMCGLRRIMPSEGLEGPARQSFGNLVVSPLTGVVSTARQELHCHPVIYMASLCGIKLLSSETSLDVRTPCVVDFAARLSKGWKAHYRIVLVIGGTSIEWIGMLCSKGVIARALTVCLIIEV